MMMRLCEGNDLWAIVRLQVSGHICACWSISLILGCWAARMWCTGVVSGIEGEKKVEGTGATGELNYE